MGEFTGANAGGETGGKGYYYSAPNTGSTNGLVWIDEDANIMFAFSAFLSEEDILHIAESTELSKTPK